MRRVENLKENFQVGAVDGYESAEDDFIAKRRINLNDLLKKRQEEKKVDKKNNIIIVSGIAAVLTVVIIVVSL